MPKSLLAAIFILVMIVNLPFLLASETITQNYSLTLTKDVAKKFELSGNSASGSEWWIEYRPPDIVITETARITDTSHCPTGAFDCGSEIVTYSIRGLSLGQFMAQFRFGHPWDHSEYYIEANLDLRVVLAETVSTVCMPNCLTGYIADYEHCTCVRQSSSSTIVMTTTSRVYGFHPENARNLYDLIDRIMNWVRCAFYRNCPS